MDINSAVFTNVANKAMRPYDDVHRRNDISQLNRSSSREQSIMQVQGAEGQPTDLPSASAMSPLTPTEPTHKAYNNPQTDPEFRRELLQLEAKFALQDNQSQIDLEV